MPDGDPNPISHGLLGHLAISPVTPLAAERADYVATLLDETLAVLATRRIEQHRRLDGWVPLLARALDPGNASDDLTARAIADQAQAAIRATLDTHCVYGHPLRDLTRLTGKWFPVAERVLTGRATMLCVGTLCGGYAHGTVIYRADYEQALAAALAQQIRDERSG